MKAFIKDIGNVEMLVTDLYGRAEKLSEQFKQHEDEMSGKDETINELTDQVAYLTTEITERDETIEELKNTLREMLPNTADRINLFYNKGITL